MRRAPLVYAILVSHPSYIRYLRYVTPQTRLLRNRSEVSYLLLPYCTVSKCVRSLSL
jgi:hypothetical protein